MASEDVIELGSSDDEAEPAIKKIKPLPNAMVHIPTKIHGVTIKPAKKSISSIPKELAGKNVTVTKISKSNILANPYAAKNKTNGKPMQQKPPVAFPILAKKPAVIQNRPINPLSIMKNFSQVVINKVPVKSPVVKNPIRIQSPRSINNLPPSITVTRTSAGIKRIAPTAATSSVRKKQKFNNKPKKTMPTEVLTVDLDDDDVSTTSTSSPQWYLRPEEQTSLLEEENNKEPEPQLESSKLVEITIEDSPVKPIQSKRTHEVGAELTVTIDDSPVKIAAEKHPASGSDGEVKVDDKVPLSKKKLEYPKEAEVQSKTVQLEISSEVPELLKETEANSKQDEKATVPAPSSANDQVIEIEESPLKVGGQATSTPKKNHPKPQFEVPETMKALQEDDELSEFHPVYRSFIKLCFQLENSDDMKKIVEKKIKTYYRQVPKDYTESDEFVDMVAGKILSMKAGPEKMYLYIKDIVDELNLQRKMAKSQVLTSITEKKFAVSESDKFLYGEESEYDTKRQRQIRKLEKTLKKLHRAIQKLEEQEVDFDDDEDSVYLLTESDEGSTSNKDSDKQLEKDPKALLQRYKERMVRVHAKFCQLTNTKMPSEPRVQIDARPGQPAGPAKRLEKWINKKVPIGTPLPFPDFHDVLRCVREANSEDKLGWNEADIMEEARDLFTRCGKKLQRRRQENEWRLAASRISVDVDPADQNTDLKKKLEDNKKVAAKKEADVFNKFADRQSQLKLEAEEIGEKEAEESPVDDDDEEEINEGSLENTEKRKERLKRLLHEQSKKGGNEPKKSVNLADSQTGDDQALTNKKCDKLVDESKKHNDENTVQSEKPESVSKPISQTKKMDVDGDIKTISTEGKSTSDKQPDQNEKTSSVKKDNINEESVRQECVDDTKENNCKNSDEDLPECAKPADNEDRTHLISDDSNKLESDIDELHLLHKFHSQDANTSTQESSDSESPIAISDTLDSSSDNKKQTASDVISIENSSYSESEINSQSFDKANKETDPVTDKVVTESVDENTELECSNIGIEKKSIQTNNDEYNESIEDILLASTDDEVELDKILKPENDECVNLKDDSISIGDTIVEGVDKPQSNTETDDSLPDKQDDASSVESVAFVSSKDDSPTTNINVECEVVQNMDKADTENSSEEKEDNIMLKQNTVKPSNEKDGAQTIEVKESSPEEIIDSTDNSSDSQKKEQLQEKDDKIEKARKSLEHEKLEKQNTGLSNDDNSAK